MRFQSGNRFGNRLLHIKFPSCPDRAKRASGMGGVDSMSKAKRNPGWSIFTHALSLVPSPSCITFALQWKNQTL